MSTNSKRRNSQPEINRIFDDLEEYLDYCRLSLCKFDPKDLYHKGTPWEEFNRKKMRSERLAKERSTSTRS
jgi:hypothetical protein